MKRHRCLLIVVCLVAPLSGQKPAEIKPLPQAHAHNDYLHDRPLEDALARGFCSVEADIFLVKGKLLVAHSVFELKQERTLEKLYLQPLLKRVKANKGRVYSDGPMFTLLIDIKTQGKNVYKTLRVVLAKYKEMLCSVEDDKFRQGAIQVIISGDRPREAIESESLRYVGIDGRLSDLESSAPAHLLPLISDRWTSHFQWRGKGEFPKEERQRLHKYVKKAHAAGRRVRFWATPENVALWAELQAAGVDHINTDELDRLKEFLDKKAGQ